MMTVVPVFFIIGWTLENKQIDFFLITAVEESQSIML